MVAFWLHKHHPKTLACNLESFSEFGYFKDLPEIVYRLLEGEDVRKKQKVEWRERKCARGRKRRESGSDCETGSRSEKKRIRRKRGNGERRRRLSERGSQTSIQTLHHLYRRCRSLQF